MQTNAYHALAASEQTGWYYQARARAVKRLVRQFISDDRPLEILDVGCGTGGTSRELEQLGTVTGLEPNATAISLLRENFPHLRAVRGSVDDIPKVFEPESFDLATVMGVLYHRDVKDPREALENVRGALKPGGWIIWNEAAYPFLRRKHDDFVQTGRRFYPRQMRRALVDAGYEVHFGSHLLAWAFPIGVALAAGHRMKSWLSKHVSTSTAVDPADDRHLPPAINAALRGITFWEWLLSLKVAGLPFGISYLVIARDTRVSGCLAVQEGSKAA